LLSEELHYFIFLPKHYKTGKIQENEVGGHVARMGEERNMYRVLMGKPEGKRPLGRPRRRWDQNGC
jgi:hypothetical protein